MPKSIKTPRSSNTLKFNSNFGSKYTNNFKRAQMSIDQDVLRYNAPLIPRQTGTLIKSGTINTVIGTGKVRYVTPYAARQYYETAQSRSYDANRGAKWFERMKIRYKNAIFKTAEKIAKGQL